MRYRDEHGRFISEAEYLRRRDEIPEMDSPEDSEDDGWDYEFDEEEYFSPE